GVLSAGVGGLDLRDQADLHHLAAYPPDPPLSSAPHPVVKVGTRDRRHVQGAHGEQRRGRRGEGSGGRGRRRG
ncbi:unnamed protein product, partial [Ectocarpus fasciculatus]